MGSGDPPFRRLSRRVGGENSKFLIFFDDLVDEEGNEVPDFLVVAPKIRDAVGVTGVAVLPLIKGRVGLVRVYRHAVGRFGYEVPRGFVDGGERPAQAASRELREETGLVCGEEQLRDLGAVAPDPGILAAHVRLFSAKCEDAGMVECEGELGHRGFHWYAECDIEGFVRAGEIQDAISLLALYRSGVLAEPSSG